MRCRLRSVIKVARILNRYLPNLLSYFRHRITSATSEGYNSVIQALKYAVRGFRSFQNHRTRILFFCGKLDLRPRLPAAGIPEEPKMREVTRSRPLCMLPAGTYWIGSDSNKNASPRHVRRFAGDVWLDCDLVTWLDFVGFVTGGGYADPAWWRTADCASFPESARPSSVDARCEAVRSLTLSAAPPEWTRPRGDLPVLGLTWFEAAAVCQFFNARLPFETEWEAATKSGLLGDDPAVPVAQEWCLDAYASRYWRADAGVRGRAWQAGEQVVLRGHSTREPAVGATARRSADPAVGAAGRGFRRVWDQAPVA